MKISAFSYVRNGIQMGYPFLESIQSVLPIVDEFIVVVGDSTDGTREAILKLSPKIKIIDTVWDLTLRKGGKIFAQQANLGLDEVTGDWIIHIQADEVIHERDSNKLLEYIHRFDARKEVEGLLFPFLNFRGDYDHIHTGRTAHRFEIRAFRKNSAIRSFRDSQGFRKFSSLAAYEGGEKGEKLRVIKLDVPIYHYSYVRPPRKMKEKAELFTSFYVDDNGLKEIFKGMEEFNYSEVDKLEVFTGTHPAVMKEVIGRKDWEFKYTPGIRNPSLRHRILNKIEDWTGYRIGEYKNYKLIGKIS
jgi:glycosyltransferase involved in cell wall biosynthesis